MRSKLARTALMAAVAVLVLVGTACTPIGKIQTTTIKVEVSSERLLHLAIIPRVLPDGSPVDAVKADLLENVAARVGGIPEAVTHRETGYVADYGDLSDLVAGLRWVIGSEERRLRLGVAARKRVLRHFDEKLMIDRYVELYRSVFEGRSEGAGSTGT